MGFAVTCQTVAREALAGENFRWTWRRTWESKQSETGCRFPGDVRLNDGGGVKLMFCPRIRYRDLSLRFVVSILVRQDTVQQITH